MADTAGLELRGVTAGYRGRTVLRDLSLTCPRGELVGVLGANGCGKTTLVRVAAGVLRPAAGAVTVGGRDLTSLAPRECARQVAVLPQEGGPLFSSTALETVLLGRHPWHPAFAFESEDDVVAAERALAEVDASDLRERDIATLSGGERQRVLLARALCQGGRVLLCDEPTAHLDMRHQAAVFRLLRGLAHADGPDGARAVLVVTHDVNLAAQACDRVALLRAPTEGVPALVASGRPGDVITPENLRAAYGIDTSVHTATGGAPFVERTL